MSKEEVIRKAIEKYNTQKKAITIDAMTGHLDCMEHIEVERMLRGILEEVYDAGAKHGGIFIA